MSEDYFTAQKRLGDEAEDLVKDYLVGIKDYKVKKVDHTKYPFDLAVQRKDKTTFSIEVKVYGDPSYSTIFAETVQISKERKQESCPEYLTHYEEIEYMIYVDLSSKVGYVYNMRSFAKYVLRNKSKEAIIGRGTAKGIKILRTDVDAGFIKIVDLSRQ